MSSISKRRKEGSKAKIKTMGDHREFLKRITKTLYYGELPTLPCLSLPVTEVSCEAWSDVARGRSLRRLRAGAAAGISRDACVSPCSLVLALLYLERLKRCNPDYLNAAVPADLFLVSLMVSNKFLQDDGEDDDVLCSEWAASGGLRLDQLKKLEMEFLNAIEWKVFVSEESFEAGLSWLERRVALRQARARGFFTYTDLAAASDGLLLGELLRETAALCGLCLAALLALLTSTLLVAQCLPAGGELAPTPDVRPAPSSPLSNATVDQILASEVEPASDPFVCCDSWSRYREGTETKRNWFDGVVVYDWRSFEPWWSRTSVMNWLYQSSLISPVQRWLEEITLYARIFKTEAADTSRTFNGQCNRDGTFSESRCVRQWLNLSKLSVFVASVSDR